MLALAVVARDPQRLAIGVDDDDGVMTIRLARAAEVLDGFAGTIASIHGQIMTAGGALSTHPAILEIWIAVISRRGAESPRPLGVLRSASCSRLA